MNSVSAPVPNGQMTVAEAASATLAEAAGQRAAANFATRLGLTADDVGYIDPQWGRLLSRGGVVHLTVGRMRFRTKRQPSDFGLQPRSPEEARAWRAVASDLGKRPLVPESITGDFDSDESEARTALENRSFRLFDGTTRFVHEGKPYCNLCRADVVDEDDTIEFPLLAHARSEHANQIVRTFEQDQDGNFVLDKNGVPVFTETLNDGVGKERGWNYRDLVDIFTKIQQRYMARADQLIDNLPAYQDQLAGHYAIVADRAYAQMLQDNVPNLPDQETFIKDKVAEFLRINETPEAIRASFKFRWRFEVLPLAEEIARDQAAAGQIFGEALAQREAAVELARARTQMERDMMAAKVEARREQWDGFWADVKADARQMIYNVMVDCIASLDGKASMPPSNREALRRLIEKIKDTQFWPDDEIEAQMRQVRTLLSAIDSSRPDTDKLGDLMKRIGATARMSLIDLNRPTLRDVKKRTGEDVGIPEERAALAVMLGQKVERDVRPAIQVGMRAAQTVTLPQRIERDINPGTGA